jgi:hypothetical protein
VSYGFVSGYSNTSEIQYCPKCGERVYSFCGDGSASCECGYKFYVVEKEQEGAENK